MANKNRYNQNRNSANHRSENNQDACTMETQAANTETTEPLEQTKEPEDQVGTDTESEDENKENETDDRTEATTENTDEIIQENTDEKETENKIENTEENAVENTTENTTENTIKNAVENKTENTEKNKRKDTPEKTAKNKTKNESEKSTENTESNTEKNDKKDTKNKFKNIKNSSRIYLKGGAKKTLTKKRLGNKRYNQKHMPGGFDAKKLLELIGRYRRYIAAGVLFLAMILVLAKCTGPVTDEPGEPAVDEQEPDIADQTEEFEVDAIPEVNQLISDYYTAYAAGDVDALEELAQPISETEKSYIQLFSEYVEAYENISCYTKSGLNAGDYIVSVYLEIKFKDVATAAPGLDFFYLRTDESGRLYIDNAYSQFNQSNMEESTEADIQALINEFEQAEDVLLLQSNVQQKYEDAIAADADLNTMANETIPNAIETWVKSLTQAADETDEDGEAENGDDASENESEEETGAEENEDDGDSDGEAKTAYTMDGINLRKEPSTSSSVLAVLSLGTELEIYPDTEEDGWVKAVYKGKTGYVKREYVTTNQNKVPGTAETEDETQTVTALPEGAQITLTGSVNVRASMSETAEKIGIAYEGDVVTVIMSYAEGWTKVEWNGQTGYIKTELIK